MADESRATSLTPEQINELRKRASREAGPFTNPSVLETPIHNAEWATAILGRPYSGPRSVTWPERYLLYIATQAEPAPPPPPKATAALARYRAEEEQRKKAFAEEYRRKTEEWKHLEAALREAGVRVEVRHNYTSHRHLDGYRQGADHVYLLDDLHVGRLKRKARQVLCWVPSRAKDLQHFDSVTDERLPTCQACLHIARRLAAKPEERG